MISLAPSSVSAIPAVCTTAAATTTSHSILDPIAKPIADVLAAFYSVIPNYAVAILLLSVVWMLIISPLTLKTTRSMLAMQKLSPELKRLQEKHRNDRQALSQAQMALYKEHNVSPFGSCLPTILPLPVFIALFRVIDGLSTKTTVQGVSCAAPRFVPHNSAMYHSIVAAGGHLNAFGLDLSKAALSSHGSVAAAIPFFVLLLIMMGTQYVQTAQMMSRNPAAQQNSQMAMMKFLPLVFGVICIRFPAGVVLYYAMSNLCRIGQQELMYRFDPKVKALAIKDVKEIETNAGVEDDGEAAGMFSRRKADGEASATAPSGGRTRFRDLLGGEMQRQAEAREQAKTAKSGGVGASKAGGGAAKSSGSGSKPGGGGSKAGAAKAAAARSGSNGRPSGPSRQGTAGRPSGSSRSGTATKPASAAKQTQTARKQTVQSQPPKAGNGQAGNGQSSGNGQSGADSTKPAAPRTGAGNRTGAGGGRTGAGGSRNRRRGQ